MRGTLLMGLSNQHGHLLLATSNKSEVAVGYSTLYGDAAGGFAPIKDVPKTLVWELARWRNEYARERGETEPIPQNSIDKPPSAELAPGQQDSDSLPSYEELDAVIADYVDRDLGMAELLERGHDAEVVARVLRLVDMAEFKRRQSAPGNEDQPEGVRPGSAAADHQPVAGDACPRVREGAAQHDRVGAVRRARRPPGCACTTCSRPRSAARSGRCSPPTTPTARPVFEEAGIPVMLVGDSVGQRRPRLLEHGAGDRRGHAAA